jgi:hypothetical protein
MRCLINRMIANTAVTEIRHLQRGRPMGTDAASTDRAAPLLDNNGVSMIHDSRHPQWSLP